MKNRPQRTQSPQSDDVPYDCVIPGLSWSGAKRPNPLPPEIATPWTSVDKTLPPVHQLVVVLLDAPRRPAFGMMVTEAGRIIPNPWRLSNEILFGIGGNTVVAWKPMPKPVRGWSLHDVLCCVMAAGLNLPGDSAATASVSSVSSVVQTEASS
jgi:hypothetical protein